MLNLTTSILDVKNLTVQFKTKKGNITTISDISFSIKPSETICIVGESGSGKSVTAKSILRLIEHENGVITNGQILFKGNDLTKLSSKELNNIRGKKIAMIFQEPSAAFDPVFTIGSQISETIIKHLGVSKKEAWERGVELLRKVGLSEPEVRMKQYPSELSGGMLQRAMIAMALSCNPELLIADEPTTALDVTIQTQIIQLLKSLQQEFGMAILLITHDLGIAAQVSDRIIFMYAGVVFEEGTVQQIFNQPHHPYSKGLLQSIPKLTMKKSEELYSMEGNIPSLTELPTGCRFHPRCEFATEKCRIEQPHLMNRNGQKSACWHTDQLLQVEEKQQLAKDNSHEEERLIKQEPLFEVKNLSKHFYIKNSNKKLIAVNNVSFQIFKGETLGLVGESGSGKSTLGRTLLQLEKATSGDVLFEGDSLVALKPRKLREKRKEMQMIFQDPFGSLNPRWTIKEIIAEPIKTHQKHLSKEQVEQRVFELLEQVGLKKEWANRYPHEFSGGQRQRISIARAISVNPSFVLADEAVSALDVSVQAQIVKLLKKIQKESNLTFLFIGHDLSVVRHISDRIVVMYLGKIVEIAPSEELFENPIHPYTKALIESIPSVEKRNNPVKKVLQGEIPSPTNPPSGCVFRTRCPFATEKCALVAPELTEISQNRYVACHY